MASKKPTVSDVARVAQVSKATVSRALRGVGSVDPELVARVEAAAAQLEYTPNSVAQDLRFGSSRSIGILVPDIANPYFSILVQEIARNAAVSGYRTLLSDTLEDADGELESLRVIARHVDGVVLCSPRMSDQDLAQAAKLRTPIVMTARVAPGLALTTVTVNSYSDCRELIGRLHQLGHRRLAYIAGPERSWQNAERLRAVEDARVFGVDTAVIPGGTEVVDGYRAVDAALAAEPTAIVAFNDILAIGIYERLRERAVRIPDDVSVASFDDISFAAHLSPTLTTVRTDRADIGRLAFEAIVGRIEDRDIAHNQSVESGVVMRDSTGPAPTSDLASTQ